MTRTPPLWTTRRLRCQDGTGTYVRLTASAFAGRQCECAAAARPSAAGRLSGMKIEPQKCAIFYAKITQKFIPITQSLCTDYAVISTHYAKITQSLCKDYADSTTYTMDITMRFESHFKSSFGNVKAFNLKKLKLSLSGSLSPSPQWPQAALRLGG